MPDVIKKAQAAVAEAAVAVEKTIVPFRAYPRQPEATRWNWTPAEFDALLRGDDWPTVASAHTWFDSEADENNPPQEKGAYKLPHHYWRDGRVVTNFRGVVAAMAALFGARGGVKVPDADRRGIYNHLAKHYREFDREPPPFDREEREKRALGALKMIRPLAARNAELVLARSVGPFDAHEAFAALPEAIDRAVAALEKADIQTGAVGTPSDQSDAFVVVPDVVAEAFYEGEHWSVLKDACELMWHVAAYDLDDLAKSPVLKSGAEGEAGVHLHKLAADRAKTAKDGQHRHLFLIGERVVATAADGEHEHAGPGSESRTKRDGTHAHTVKLPNGEPIETDESGEHDHDAQVATTGWDGSHQHRLKLPDGSTVMSMTAVEFAERFGRREEPDGEAADSEGDE